MTRILCMLSTVAITPNQKGDVNSPGEPQPLYMHLCITQFAYPIILSLFPLSLYLLYFTRRCFEALGSSIHNGTSMIEVILSYSMAGIRGQVVGWSPARLFYLFSPTIIRSHILRNDRYSLACPIWVISLTLASWIGKEECYCRLHDEYT